MSDNDLSNIKSKDREVKLSLIENQNIIDFEGNNKIFFSDIGGLAGIKKQIERKIILPFRQPGLFKRFGRKSGGGVLLYGPPGCGKTILARATAGECGAEFYNIEISDILDKWLGSSEHKLHEVFELARRTKPSVVFFDELEGLASKRTGCSASSTIVSQFLSELDGFNKNNDGVLMLAATNVPWALDLAFRRPGRFDRILMVPPPDEVAREQIFEIKLKNKPIEKSISYKSLAKLTSGYSGADIEAIVEIACDLAIEKTLESGKDEDITDMMLREAIKETSSTALEWFSTAKNYARYANQSGQYDEILKFLKKNS